LKKIFIIFLCFSAVLYAEIPWSIGENLKFSVQYGALTAGQATMTVESYETFSGHQTFKLVSVLETNDYFSKIFRINDRYESYFDINLLSSRKFIKHIEEGSYQADREVIFLPEVNTALYGEEETFPILENTQDLLSCIYYARTLPLEVGDSYPINIHDTKENFSGYLQVIKRESISTPLGEFDCVVVNAQVEGATIFASKDGLEVWYTDDQWHIPIMISLKIMVGSIQMVLVDADMGG